MKKGLLSITLAIFFGLSFNSCVPPTEGCTDPSANNFDALAEKDDGTCIHRGEIGFWTDADYGCGDIEVFVNGESVGVISEPVTSEVPDCNNAATLSVELAEGSYDVYATDSCGTEWNQTVNVESITCSMIMFGK